MNRPEKMQKMKESILFLQRKLGITASAAVRLRSQRENTKNNKKDKKNGN